MNQFENLNCLNIGDKGKILQLNSTGAIRRRLLDIGLINDTVVECVGKSPSGDPCAYSIRGAIIAIRHEDCENIIIDRHPKGSS